MPYVALIIGMVHPSHGKGEVRWMIFVDVDVGGPAAIPKRRLYTITVSSLLLRRFALLLQRDSVDREKKGYNIKISGDYPLNQAPVGHQFQIFEK